MQQGSELENVNLNRNLKTAIRESFLEDSKGSFEASFEGPDFKAKTSLRITYEAQVEVLKRQLGDLESIRERLGLSQRKISQLLMVDPSSWTRWTKKGDEAPPQIWRALQWYLALQDKIPGLSNQYFLDQNHRSLDKKNAAEIQQLKAEFSGEILSLKNKLRFYRGISFVSIGLASAVVLAFLFNL